MATVLIPIQEPIRRRPAPDRLALWDLGFRPFYLLAAAFAALSVPLWALQFSGVITHAWLQGPLWHAHEMVFGYTLAVVIGFLFTAGRNWSGQPTPTGRPLMALAALWLTARVLVLTPFGTAAALVNTAVPLWAAWGLWRALKAGHNQRNYFFVGLLVAMGGASAMVHGVQLGMWSVPEGLAARMATGLGIPVALDVVMFMMAVMGGRVIPMFSNNGVAGMNARRHPRVEKIALGSVLALLATDALGLHGGWAAAVLTVALAAHATRLTLWEPWKTTPNPLVWVLHAAYFWVLVHLGLRVGAELGLWAPGPATHALTLGGIGMMTLGMITRTALGHTGRALKAGPMETGAYVAMLVAALVRVVLPLVAPATLVLAVNLSAALWTLAFGLYLVRYTPILMRPRADGQPG